MPCEVCRPHQDHPEWCECIHCDCYRVTTRVKAALNRRDLERGHGAGKANAVSHNFDGALLCNRCFQTNAEAPGGCPGKPPEGIGGRVADPGTSLSPFPHEPDEDLKEYGRLVLAASGAVEALNKQERKLGAEGTWIMSWMSGGGG